MPTAIKIKKRNGTIADFEPKKIAIAMRKAFASRSVGISEERLAEMTNIIVSDPRFQGLDLIDVERIQDNVELTLMREGFFDVAKAYIVYRHEHAKERTEKVIEKIEENELYVIKRDGSKEKFSLEKLTKHLSHHLEGIEKDIDIEKIVSQCRLEVYDEIKTTDITRALIMVVRSLIERDPAYSKLAARLLLSIIYQEVLGENLEWSNLPSLHARAFEISIKHGIAMGRLDPRLAEFDLSVLGNALQLPRDDYLDYLGLQTIYDRYFVREQGARGKVIETPQMFWMRIAMGTTLSEAPEKREKIAGEFYEIMSEFYYTPSTPTLFHSGTPKPQLSSCYLNTVPDSLDGIFKSYSDNAQLSKWSGGIGTDWTYLRATGAYIKGTGVESQGVIPFLKIANDVTVAINRSGRRRGAACVYLETWHYDIIDFLELRKGTGDERRRTHDMDTANWIPDLFMKRVREGGQWTLFSPEEVPGLHDLYGKAFEQKYVEYEKRADEGKIALFKRMPAGDLWRKMLSMLFETGHPWVTFKDPSNVRSPQDHVGVVHNSNLCTEITLNTSFDETAVCNLGSLNFAKFVVNGAFDAALVGRVVKVAMRMLDNVIDINFYPTEDSKRSNMRHRPVGLGVRGFQDALYLLGINFDSEASVQFADESMEVVSYFTLLSSSQLAKERGAYLTYKGSKWDRGIFPQDTIDLLEMERGEPIPLARGGKLDWTPVREHVKAYGMRNSNCLAIAPTATTANIVGCVPTIEPIYKNIYVKSNQAGDFVVINKYLVEELKAISLWNSKMINDIKYHDGSIQRIAGIPQDIKDRYKEVFEIDAQWLIKSAAYRGKWIDQSQSLNIYYSGTSGKDLNDIYFYAWTMGLKTTYYLRTLGASQVEKSTISTAEYGSTHHRKAAIEAPTTTVVEESVVVSSTTETIVSTVMTSMQTPVSRIIRIEDAVCESCEA